MMIGPLHISKKTTLVEFSIEEYKPTCSRNNNLPSINMCGVVGTFDGSNKISLMEM